MRDSRRLGAFAFRSRIRLRRYCLARMADSGLRFQRLGRKLCLYRPSFNARLHGFRGILLRLRFVHRINVCRDTHLHFGSFAFGRLQVVRIAFGFVFRKPRFRFRHALGFY